MKKPYLYCKKCKKYPKEIIAKYLEPIEDRRLWYYDEYEPTVTNLLNTEYQELCANCRTKLQNHTATKNIYLKKSKAG